MEKFYRLGYLEGQGWYIVKPSGWHYLRPDDTFQDGTGATVGDDNIGYYEDVLALVKRFRKLLPDARLEVGYVDWRAPGEQSE